MCTLLSMPSPLPGLCWREPQQQLLLREILVELQQRVGDGLDEVAHGLVGAHHHERPPPTGTRMSAGIRVRVRVRARVCARVRACV